MTWHTTTYILRDTIRVIRAYGRWRDDDQEGCGDVIHILLYEYAQHTLRLQPRQIAVSYFCFIADMPRWLTSWVARAHIVQDFRTHYIFLPLYLSVWKKVK